MKKVIAAMAAMFIAVVLLGGLWGILLKPIMGGGGADLSFIYPIYIGLILLAGLIVGAAVVLYEEIKKLQEEIKNVVIPFSKPFESPENGTALSIK